MKKTILLLAFLIIGIAAVAKPPCLKVETLFDGSYNSNKSVSLQISKSLKEYFRGCTVSNNPELVKKIEKMFKEDAGRAEQSQELTQNGRPSYSSMIILNNGFEIYVGLSYESAGGCYLFIKGSPEAFR